MTQTTSNWFRNSRIRQGILRAIHARMKADPSVICLGEGQHMKMKFDAPAILAEFPERVLTLPISEDANTNFAVGLALAGLTPIVDVITADFLYRTFDSIANTCRVSRFVHDELPPIIIRAEFMTAGPTTGARPEALFMHIPGINVVVPSNPKDACGLMLTALEQKGTTIFFEDREIEDATTLPEDEPDDVPIPFGQAKIRKPGEKLTVVSYGLMARRLDVLLRDTDYELIDLRTLWPLDIVTIARSVRRTRRLLFVEPDVEVGGVGAEVVATIAEGVAVGPNRPFRVVRLGGPRETISSDRREHERLFPSDAAVLEAAGRLAE